MAYTFGKTTGNNNGNLTQQTITVGSAVFTQNYTYDTVNRLLSATETNTGLVGWSETFTYDQYGNRTLSQGSLGMPIWAAPGYDLATNHVTGTGWAYDPAGTGNLTTAHTNATMSYDAEGRVATYTDGVHSANFVYDGEGRRVQATVDGATTNYVYDAQGQLIAETGLAATQTTPLGRQYLLTDYLGSTRVVADSKGNAMERRDYTPFGEEIPVSGCTAGSGLTGSPRCNVPGYLSEVWLRQKFTGKERAFWADGSEFGLDYFGARYFSGAMGRFTSPDPLMASAHASNPQTWNRYAYALNNPLRFIDPTGTKEESAEDCQSNPNCVVVKLNVVYDKNANGGSGLTEAQKKAFDAQLQKAKDQYGDAAIHFDVTRTTGGTGSDGLMYGLLKGATNIIVSDSTPTGDAGTSQVNSAGYALTGIDVTKSDSGTLAHELAHQFTGDTTGIASAISSYDPTRMFNRFANTFFDFINDTQRAQLTDQHSQFIKQPCTQCNVFNSGARQYQGNLTQQAIRPQQ